MLERAAVVCFGVDSSHEKTGPCLPITAWVSVSFQFEPKPRAPEN